MIVKIGDIGSKIPSPRGDCSGENRSAPILPCQRWMFENLEMDMFFVLSQFS